MRLLMARPILDQGQGPDQRGPDGLSETPVYWAFCFGGPKVAQAGGFDDHEQALEMIRERCPA
jgi:hypothetical protein